MRAQQCTLIFLLGLLRTGLCQEDQSQGQGQDQDRQGQVSEACRPELLTEQQNYICVNDSIVCLPGWKVRKGGIRNVNESLKPPKNLKHLLGTTYDVRTM